VIRIRFVLMHFCDPRSVREGRRRRHASARAGKSNRMKKRERAFGLGGFMPPPRSRSACGDCYVHSGPPAPFSRVSALSPNKSIVPLALKLTCSLSGVPPAAYQYGLPCYTMTATPAFDA